MPPTSRGSLRCCALAAVLGALAPSARAELAVTGAVVVEGGVPLAGARILLRRVDPDHAAGLRAIEGLESTAVAAAETDAQGRFRLAAPTAGAFEVAARAEGRAPMVLGPLIVTRDRELPALALPAAEMTALRVVDAAGMPLPGAWTAIRGPQTPSPGAAIEWRLDPRGIRTDSEGRATLPILHGSGPVEVEVLPPGRAVPVLAPAREGLVRLPTDAVVTVTLRAIRGSEPAAGVLVRHAGRGWPLGVTDAAGALALRVPAGTLAVVELVPSDGPALRAALTAEPVALVPLVPAAGRVLDASSGKGLAGALAAPVGDLGAAVATDERGRFRHLVPEAAGWRYEVHAPGYLPQRIAAGPEEIAGGRLPSVSLEPSVRVIGRILTAAGRPVAGAAVEAVPESALSARPLTAGDPVTDRAVSDAEGRFALAGLRAESGYELRVRSEGFLPAAVAAITIAARREPTPVEVRLQPARAAVGRVVDAEGLPLAGALVILRPAHRIERRRIEPHTETPPAADDPATAVSGADGRFVVPRCPAAEFDAEIRQDGYAPARRVGLRAGPGTAPVDLGVVALRPGARLAGRVVDPGGKPVSGAEIFLFDRLPPAPAVSAALRDREPQATSGGDGSFAIGDLPAGVPQGLVVIREGFLPALVRGARPPTAKPVLVRLEAGFELAGRVVDEADEPVPRAAVSLGSQAALEDDPYQRPRGRFVLRETVTDSAGRFVIREAPAGPAELRVSADGFLTLENFEIELPHDPKRPVELRLTRGAVLWGRVTNAAGDPIAGARVLVNDAAGASDAEGYYRLAGVGEGERRLDVVHPSYRRVERRVTIEAGENRLDIELPAGVAVSGWVLDSEGGPVAGAQVRLSTAGRREPREHRARCDEKGRFRLEPVAADVYHLEATALDGARGEAAEPVVVGAEPLDGLELRIAGGAVVRGRILGLGPEDLNALAVEAEAENGRRLPGRVRADGTYEIGPLAPGGWLLRALLWAGEREARARIEVGADDREVERDLDFGRRLTLSGVVLFDEQPLADAILSVRGQRFAIERSAQTSFDGAFRIDDLEPDRYRLGVALPDQQLAHNQWLELADHSEVTIRIERGAAAGSVRNAADGRPIGGAIVRLEPTEGAEFVIIDVSESDGGFHLLRVPPGSHRLEVSAEGFVGAERLVQVAAGEVTGDLDLELQPTAGGELRVTLAGGGVPALVHLLALDAGGAAVVAESRVPDPDGRVPLATLPPGSWHLLIRAPETVTESRIIAVPGEPVEVTLTAAGRLHVRVRGLAATDVLATVTLLDADQQPLPVLGPGGRFQTVWAMTAGRAVVEGIPAGSWLVRVTTADGRVWTAGVVTGAGDTVLTLD